MKKLIAVVFAAVCMLSGVKIDRASAEVAAEMRPYCTGYTSGCEVEIQKTVYDMTDGAARIAVTAEYELKSVGAGAAFYYPAIVSPYKLDEIEISVDGEAVTPQIFYGNMPIFKGTEEDCEALEAGIESAAATELAEERGVLYTFEEAENGLEYSFTKAEGQSVWYSGHSPIVKTGNEYRMQTNGIAGYQIFASGGELENFAANAGYTKAETSYKDYLDGVIDEIILQLGEEMRGVYYSRFNRSENGEAVSLGEAVIYEKCLEFAVLKTELPMGAESVIVRSYTEATETGEGYAERALAAYEAGYLQEVEIKYSKALPYLANTNLKIENGKYAGEGQKEYYFLVSEAPSGEWWQYLLIGGLVLVAIGLIFLAIKRKKGA